MNALNLSLFIPELMTLVFFAYFILESVLAGKKDRPSIFNEMAVGALLLGAALFLFGNKFGAGFGGMAVADAFGFYFKVFFTAVFFVVAFISREQLKNTAQDKQGFGLILWSSLIGLYFLTSASHLLVLFVAIEILTMSLYILATYGRRTLENTSNAKAIEAGLKYLILGSVASAFMIFGIALLYFQTGTLSFAGLASAQNILWSTPIGILGLLLFFAGIGFKIAAAPFHFWVPDVYEGSPAPVSAFLSVASKAAGFLVLIRFFQLSLSPLPASWQTAFAVIAAVTLLYGSLGALAQTSLKRLLGYSSISHAGYLLIAFTAGTAPASQSILYYLAGYAASTLAAFYAITLIEKQQGSDASKNLDGLAQTSPFLAGVFVVSLFSLAGIPPLAGFMGKFWILFSALQAGQNMLVGLSLIAIVLGIFYYLSLVSRIILREPQSPATFEIPVSAKWLLGILSLLSIAIGLFQAPLIQAAVIAIKN